MSNIKGDVHELGQINAEIKRLYANIRKLKKQATAAEERITQFLEAQDHPGVKYQGTAVMLENKSRRAPKATKDREADAIDVLRNHGVENAKEVLAELIEARKGDEIDSKKLKIKQLDR